MSVKEIPDEDHIVRQVTGSRLSDDKSYPLAAAFDLRPSEEYLSVNWVECFPGEFESQLQSTREAIARTRSLAKGHRLAVAICAGVRDLPAVTGVTHEPRSENEGHSGIRFSPSTNLSLAMQLALEFSKKEPLAAVAPKD